MEEDENKFKEWKKEYDKFSKWSMIFVFFWKLKF